MEAGNQPVIQMNPMAGHQESFDPTMGSDMMQMRQPANAMQQDQSFGMGQQTPMINQTHQNPKAKTNQLPQQPSVQGIPPGSEQNHSVQQQTQMMSHQPQMPAQAATQPSMNIIQQPLGTSTANLPPSPTAQQGPKEGPSRKPKSVESLSVAKLSPSPPDQSPMLTQSTTPQPSMNTTTMREPVPSLPTTPLSQHGPEQGPPLQSKRVKEQPKISPISKPIQQGAEPSAALLPVPPPLPLETPPNLPALPADTVQENQIQELKSLVSSLRDVIQSIKQKPENRAVPSPTTPATETHSMGNTSFISILDSI